MGRKEKGYTKQQILKAISQSDGIVRTIQKRLGCDSWATARKYIDKWQDTRKAWESENNQTNDLAQSVVVEDIKRGNVQTAKWWLERRRRKEYYISHYGTQDQQEANASEDTDIKIEIVDGDNDDKE